MKYRNIKTGHIIDVPSEVRGSNWELVDGTAPAKEPAVSTQDGQKVKRPRKTKKD